MEKEDPECIALHVLSDADFPKNVKVMKNKMTEEI